MRILVPQTFTYGPTWESLDYQASVYNLDPDDEMSYRTYFQMVWCDNTGFISCEHDTIVPPGMIKELEDCPEAWCCVKLFDGCPPTLGLVKFTVEFIKANPTIWDTQPTRMPDWASLDTMVIAHADRECHMHGPPYIINARPYGDLSHHTERHVYLPGS